MVGGASADPLAPDGFIVYSSGPRNGTWDLWLTTSRSNTERRLTNTSEGEFTPAWAHDGRRIAFIRDGIYAIDAYTGMETLLTSAGAFTQPAWSSDDAKLVFDGRLSGDPGIAAHLFTMPSNGGAIQQLTFGDASDSGASWSPVSDLIAFSRAAPNQNEIWLMNADGSNQHAIPTGLFYAQMPDWSPDGQWIVFVGTINNSTLPELYKVRPDGTQLTQVSFQSQNSMDSPSWSPDGSLILADQFVQHGTNGQFDNELVVVPANGGTAELLGPGVRHLQGQLFADWQPLP
jgi:TolB protein